jgi:hypothetical protein
VVLKGETRITRSKTSYTQYVTIPSWIVRDSQYPFKEGEEVEIHVDPVGRIEIRKKKEVTER